MASGARRAGAGLSTALLRAVLKKKVFLPKTPFSAVFHLCHKLQWQANPEPWCWRKGTLCRHFGLTQPLGMPTQLELQALLSSEAWGQLVVVLRQLQQNLSGQLNVRSVQTEGQVLWT